MKTASKVLIMTLAVVLISCTTTVKFPVSKIAPAAEGVVKIKKDKNGNYQIDLTVKYLSNPDRLNPPRSQYIVWLLTQDSLTRNMGRLVSDNKNKARFKNATSFRPTQIFITAENDGEITSPGTQELFRSEQLSLK